MKEVLTYVIGDDYRNQLANLAKSSDTLTSGEDVLAFLPTKDNGQQCHRTASEDIDLDAFLEGKEHFEAEAVVIYGDWHEKSETNADVWHEQVHGLLSELIPGTEVTAVKLTFQ